MNLRSTIPTALLAVAFLALLASGCGSDTAATQRPAVVFAAASLTAAFEELQREFERTNAGAAVELHFAGTPQLVLQVREGAPADVFASADRVNMHRVVETGRVVGEPATFATNRLAIVVAPANPRSIGSLAHLAREDLRVVLCGPEVPAGRYAREALAKAGATVRSVSDEPSVKAVVSKVAFGEADAGIVYVTDAASAEGAIEAVAIPAEQNVVGTYPIARLAGGRNGEVGERFVAFVRSPAGQAVLARFGFGPP